MEKKRFLCIAPTLPDSPGIYKYYDRENQLLYVGKAKNLKKRISSYFLGKTDNAKTAELVRKIESIEWAVVDDEADAFFLEDSLIKQYKPHYNIRLKDDKTYPYLVIRKEPFPRVYITRRKKQDGSMYFGPYTSTQNIQEILTFVKSMFPLRSCALRLTETNIQKKTFNVCLEYHLGNCKGPCEGLQSRDDYDAGIQRLQSMIRGDVRPLTDHLKKEIKACVSTLAFEQAAQLQTKLDQLQAYKAKSTVVNMRTGTVDVFSLITSGNRSFVNYLAVFDGRIIHSKNSELIQHLDESPAAVLNHAMAQLRASYNSTAQEIIVPFDSQFPDKQIRCVVPKTGEKKKLLDLSEKNARSFQESVLKKRIFDVNTATSAASDILAELQKSIRLKERPEHIECFDNSNIQGAFPVAAMVCFKNGLPEKKEYRHYNIKSVTGIDDFATMREIVYRRYHRLIQENKPLPNLVIIDGGKGQLNAACESLQSLGIYGRFAIVGLAKNCEELFFPGDRDAVRLDWNSDVLSLIRRIRDEVHRFGLRFHRDQRSRGFKSDFLTNIKGIGPETAAQLLRKFKSVGKIKTLSFDILSKEIGIHRAQLIFQKLHGAK
ncbi:MAG: excinuclease ABC subunit UvrC [Ferruginibacter sp.]